MEKVFLILERLFKFFASLKLAVIIIVGLGVISAVGTVYEARYDAQYAQKVVYHSVWMYLLMALLCVNLINVMIDRLPWKKHHTGFILAHVGIIVLIAGSLVTRIWGVDGSVAIDIGESNRYVMLPDTQLTVHSSFGTGSYELIYRSEVDFLLRPPRPDRDVINLGGRKLVLKDYYHYATVEDKIIPTDDPGDAPALRIQLQNENVNLTEWLLRDRRMEYDVLDLGPAQVILTELPYNYTEGNILLLRPSEGGRVSYTVYTESQGGIQNSGVIEQGQMAEVGWMGLELRLLRYMPNARRIFEFNQVDRPTTRTTSVLRVEFDGREHWLALNASVRVFTNTNMFILSFSNKRIDLGFEIFLEEFTVGRYPGTQRAASYASDVVIPDLGPWHISMNEPLKYQGYTFYQASFQENEMGEATTSILSVNKDPGRFWKYLGSFLIVLGTTVMFYFKRYRSKIFGVPRS